MLVAMKTLLGNHDGYDMTREKPNGSNALSLPHLMRMAVEGSSSSLVRKRPLTPYVLSTFISITRRGLILGIQLTPGSWTVCTSATRAYASTALPSVGVTIPETIVFAEDVKQGKPAYVSIVSPISHHRCATPHTTPTTQPINLLYGHALLLTFPLFAHPKPTDQTPTSSVPTASPNLPPPAS